MTITNKYIPSSDAEKGVWFNNFTSKITLYATTLGITPAELTSIQKDNAFFQYLISVMELYRQYILNLAGYKNMLKHAVGQQHIGAMPVLPTIATAPASVPEGVFDRVSKLVIRIKANANYTDNIGNDLGIIAASTSVDVSALQPELTIKLDVGKPHLKWKKGVSDAIDLYVDRSDGAGYTLIGRLMRNEYLDIASLPANKVFDEWHYKAIYIIADTPVGLYSRITSVDVKKM